MIELSPFTVSTERDIGYYTPQTMAGTRVNSRLADLAASITVVTAQQLEDTAAVDINDVFMYESSTEGTHTFSDVRIDRFGGLIDNIQTAPQNANRVRGIGTPDKARNFFISLGRIPFDAYNASSVTINRGPNAVLYGLGSASGIVNVTSADAVIGPDKGSAVLRIDSSGSWRTSGKYNQTLIKDKLALLGAVLREEENFERDPSYDRTTRYFGAVTYRPFQRTTVRANYERWENKARRPNSTTPQDNITAWREAGSASFNPTTMMITRGDGTKVPVSTNAEIALFELEPTLFYPLGRMPVLFNSNTVGYDRLQGRLGAPTVSQDSQVETLMHSAHPYLLTEPYPLFVPPGVTDRSLYDWRAINFLSPNHSTDRANIFEVRIEQRILRDLHLELGYHREELDTFTRNPLSGQNGRLVADVNEVRLDGSPNPDFGRPFFNGWEIGSGFRKSMADTARATLAYELDLTKRKGVARWLGRHNVMGLYQVQREHIENFDWEDAVISVHPWAPAGAARRSGGSVNRVDHNYYVGPAGGGVTMAPTIVPDLPLGISGADYPRGSVGPTVTRTLRHFVPELNANGTMRRQPDPTYPVSGGRPVGTWVNEQYEEGSYLNNAQRDELDVKSFTAALQSFFLSGRVVTTFGWREDRTTSRDSTTPPLNDEGFRYDIPKSLRTPETILEQRTETLTAGVVVHPLKWLSFHYNDSETFNLESQALDFYGRTLPLPTGRGKDYGVSFNLQDNKLVARLNFYDSSLNNARAAGQAGTIMTRIWRIEQEGRFGLIDFYERQIELRDGLPNRSINFVGAVQQNIPSATQAQIDEIYTLTGLPRSYGITRGRTADTTTLEAKGMELELIYNPRPNWNMKFTATKQETIESETIPVSLSWLYQDEFNGQPGGRLRVWQEARTIPELRNDPRFGDINWWTHTWASTGPQGQPAGSPARWDGQTSGGLTYYNRSIAPPIALLSATQGTASPQTRKWRAALINNYEFTEGRLRGAAIGGSVRWEDKVSIGYMGIDSLNSGIIDQYDPNRPIWASGNTYVDLWFSYRKKLSDRLGLKLQLNVRNVTENPGDLQVIAANPDGTGRAYRILDGRQFILTSTLSF